MNNDGKGYDVWRHSPLRYLGYANELGESLKPIYPRLLVPSYIIAFAYVFGDTADKSLTELQNNPKDRWTVMKTTIDTLCWQTLASVLIPGFTINRVVALTEFSLKKTSLVHPVLIRGSPTAIGITIIPIIVHPIDSAVEYGMNQTLRPFMDSKFSNYKS
mmetsp:Transcript_37080/g.37754  ORF Transcript_37080/g.37754 Transcript_37080/m.37754 type:complete len:160 (+) Transcript_37080:120-599(+)